MIPSILTKHNETAPGTYSGGSYPIDEIFVTKGWNVSSCGYLEHGMNASDHRPLWVEVTKDSALGLNPAPIHTFQIRKLKTKDPKVVQQYNKVLEQELNKENIQCLNLKI